MKNIFRPYGRGEWLSALTTKRVHFYLALALLILIALFIASGAPSAIAQSGGGYDLTWNTIDGGGGTSSSGAFTLNGTIGQYDAGKVAGGSYTLNGGFWVDFLGIKITFPLIMR